MATEAQYFWGLYAAALLLVLFLHLTRARFTLAPVLAAGGLITFLVWKIAETGWWVDHGSLKLNAALLALVPAIFSGIALVYTLDGLRAARAYFFVVMISAGFAMAFLEFRSTLSHYAPLPNILYMSVPAQLALSAAFAVALLAVMAVAELCHRLVVALAPAMGLAAGVAAFAIAFSYFTYGVALGPVNLGNEWREYLVTATPAFVALALYGLGARRLQLFMPSRSLSSLFTVWHSAEREVGQARENIIGARHVIEELQSLNQSLEKERQLRRHQIDNSPLAILDVDRSGRIAEVNAAARSLLDPGASSAPIGAGTPIEHVFRGFAAVFGQRGEHSHIFDIAVPDGVRKIDVTVMPVFNGRRAAGFSVLAEDVTQRERTRVRDSMSARVHDIHRTGRVISHDFSNLLTAVESHLAAVRRELGIDASAETTDALRAIADAAARGREMLGQFGSGQVLYRPELKPHALDTLILEAVRMQRSAARDAGLTVSSSERPGLAVEVDGTQILRVLINLIGNAIRATARGGSITVEADRDGSGVAIRVTDTGRGMTPEQVAAAFDPGFSTKGQGQGGLGLAVSYLIVDAHGGRLTLDSTVGRGTTATIWLPIGNRPLAARPSDQLADGVLLYLRDEVVRGAIADRLAASGCEIAEIASGEEFAATLAEEPGRWQVVVHEVGAVMPESGEVGASRLTQIVISRQGVATVTGSAAAPATMLAEIVKIVEDCIRPVPAPARGFSAVAAADQTAQRMEEGR